MFLRRLVIIIIAITALAGGFQVMRSMGMINLIRNVNSDFILPPPKSAPVPPEVTPEKYLIVFDKDEVNSQLTEEQVTKALEYMKKEYQVINIDEKEENLEDFAGILFIFERFDHLEGLEGYIDYVKNGGSISLMIRPVVDRTFGSIAGLLGIKDYVKNLSAKKGIEIYTDIMIGAKDFKTDSDIIINSSIDLTLDDSCQMHARTADGTPLLWSRDYGDGRFVMLNGTMLNEKTNRGLISAVMGLARDELVYPVMNIKMVNIDDFPAPIPGGTDEKIYEEFSRDIPQFYREVWWSDMIKLAKKYDLKYTGFVIERYNNYTDPPFERATSEDKKNLLLYGRELLGLEGEIGLHGYNHQSLAPEGYVKQDLGYASWETIDDMVLSVEELIRFIHSVFGKYELRAYVPPSNILSPEGRDAVLIANPDLKIIASQYHQNHEGDIYAQEFEVAEDGIIEFPRITAGYAKDDEKLWNIYNGANLYGVFSHFIHPDDILDPERNEGKSWTVLAEEFDAVVGEVDRKYGWLRSFTISLAAQELVKYHECRPYIEYSDGIINIYIENYRNDIYCILRTEKEVEDSQDCEYEKIGDSAYLITVRSETCSLSLKQVY